MALKKIGSLWLKDGKNGQYMSGNIELNDVGMIDADSVGVLVFTNDKGDNDRRPDYQIMVREEDIGIATGDQEARNEKEADSKPPVSQDMTGDPGFSDDDIPF